jgi:hypothetical protein
MVFGVACKWRMALLAVVLVARHVLAFVMAVEHYLHVFVVLMFELGYRLVGLRLVGDVCQPFVNVAVWL